MKPWRRLAPWLLGLGVCSCRPAPPIAPAQSPAATGERVQLEPRVVPSSTPPSVRWVGRTSSVPPTPPLPWLVAEDAPAPGFLQVESSTLSWPTRTDVSERAEDHVPRVLYFGPTGEVSGRARVELIFSTSMEAPTARLTPNVPGRWRTVADVGLLFEPAEPLPAGTSFSVEVPAGQLSRGGQRMTAPLRYRFETAAPVAIAGPPESVGSRSPLTLTFDQPVRPGSVLGAATLFGPSGPVPLVLLTTAQTSANVSLLPKSGLVPGSRIRLQIGPGVTSASGDRRSKGTQNFELKVEPPLRLVGADCRAPDGCAPGVPIELSFDRPLDPESWPAVSLLVEPPIPGLTAAIDGEVVILEGPTAPRTRYRIELAGGLLDQRGDGLAAPVRAEVTTQGAPPALRAEGRNLLVLPAHRPPIFHVHSRGYRELVVSLYKVEPNAWPAYLRHLSRPDAKDSPTRPPGQRLWQKRLPTTEDPDRWALTAIDLGQALTASVGHALVEVRAARGAVERWQRRRPPMLRRWIQVTHLGLSAQLSRGNLLAWATDLESGRPIDGVPLRLFPGPSGRTGPDGTLLLTLPPSAPSGAEVILLAERGPDQAFLPESRWAQGQSRWVARRPPNPIKIQVLDPSGAHPLGTVAQLLGWVRRWPAGPKGQLGPAEPGAISYRLRDSVGVLLAEGQVPLYDHGSFALALPIPTDAQPGRAALTLGPPGAEELESVDLELLAPAPSATRLSLHPPPSPWITGQPMELLVEAVDALGLPWAEQPLSLTARSYEGHFRPDGFEEFSFGVDHPSWEPRSRGSPERVPELHLEGRTDATGRARFELELRADGPHPLLGFDLRVEGPAGSSGRVPVLLHPASHYPGLRLPRPFVSPGSPLLVEVVVVDLAGTVTSGRTVELALWRDGEEQVLDAGSVESGPTPRRVDLGQPAPGRYRIVARTRDDAGRTSEAERWVLIPDPALGEGQAPTAPERVTLIPDRRRYLAPQTAEVLLEAPFAPAHALLSVRRHGLLHYKSFALQGRSELLRLQLGPELAPGVQLAVELVGPSGAGDPREAWATGQVWLPIRDAGGELRLEAHPQGALAGTMPVSARGPGGPAAGVEWWWLGLAGPKGRSPEPLERFFANRNPEVLDLHGRSDLYFGAIAPPPEPPVIAEGSEPRSAPIAGSGGEPPAGRREVLHLERFVLGPDGSAQVPTARDAAETWVAIASDGGQHFGSATFTPPRRAPAPLEIKGPSFLRSPDAVALWVQAQEATPLTSPVGTFEVPASAAWLAWPPHSLRPDLRWARSSRSPQPLDLSLIELLPAPLRPLNPVALIAGQRRTFPAPGEGRMQVLTVTPPGLMGLEALITVNAPLVALTDNADQLRFELAWRGLREDEAARDPLLLALAARLSTALLAPNLTDGERLAAIEALAMARAAGLAVAEEVLESQRPWLLNGPRSVSDQAWALALRGRLGDPDLAAARRLARSEGLDPRGAAHLWPLVAGRDAPRAEARLRAQLDRILTGPGDPRALADWIEGLNQGPNDDTRRAALLTQLLERSRREPEARRALGATLLHLRGREDEELDLEVHVLGLAAPTALKFTGPFGLGAVLTTEGPLILEATGRGRIAVTPAWVDLSAPGISQGLTVTQTFDDLPVDQAALHQGRWASVRVELALSRALDAVQLEVPWPAGLTPAETTVPVGFNRLRRGVDRFRLEADRLGPGIITFSYRAWAAWPGRSWAPPVEAQADGARGQSGAGFLRIDQ